MEPRPGRHTMGAALGVGAARAAAPRLSGFRAGGGGPCPRADRLALSRPDGAAGAVTPASAVPTGEVGLASRLQMFTERLLCARPRPALRELRTRPHGERPGSGGGTGSGPALPSGPVAPATRPSKPTCFACEQTPCCARISPARGAAGAAPLAAQWAAPAPADALSLCRPVPGRGWGRRARVAAPRLSSGAQPRARGRVRVGEAGSRASRVRADSVVSIEKAGPGGSGCPLDTRGRAGRAHGPHGSLPPQLPAARSRTWTPPSRPGRSPAAPAPARPGRWPPALPPRALWATAGRGSGGAAAGTLRTWAGPWGPE